ncbi:MAG: amino acid decarboxylase, partial [Flavobacteriales bacterium]|nr:amino acid decarboxylase [Flavobacteriales bacterium]
MLEPNENEREEIHQPVINYAQKFLNTVNQTKVYNQIDYEIEDHFSARFTIENQSIEEALNHVKDFVHFPGLNPAAGGHLGYIPGGGIYTAALGDYLADIANEYAGVDFASPGGVAMENSLIKWMANLVGYPSTCGGNLASGGSIANLIAVTTAREAHNIKAIN